MATFQAALSLWRMAQYSKKVMDNLANDVLQLMSITLLCHSLDSTIKVALNECLMKRRRSSSSNHNILCTDNYVTAQKVQSA